MSEGVTTGIVLDRIVAARREALSRRQRLIPLNVLRMTCRRAEPPRDFAGALTGSAGMRIIAELKRASPSKGVLRESFDPPALASALASAGAAALSVLTEEDFFQGALEYVGAARRAATLPILRKDFLLDPWQVWESRAAGADSFLLIAAVLDDALLRELLLTGRDLGMEPLVEVHSRAELERTLAAGAKIVGVNNRDLRTFTLRLETSLELVEQIPDECIAVCESGISSRAELERLRAAGFDAFLIGEHLMRAGDPGQALRELLTAS